MVRGIVWTFFAFCILLCLIAGSAIWLLYTSAGTDYAVRQLLRQVDDTARISRIEGSFARGLSLHDLRIDQDQYRLTVARIDVVAAVSSFYPLKLTLSSVDVQDTVLVLPPSKPDDRQPPELTLSLPELPALFDLVQVEMTDLHLENMSVGQPDSFIVIHELQTTAQFSNRLLSLSRFSLDIDDLSVAASLSLDMAEPSLDMKMTLLNRGMDQPWEKVVMNTCVNRADDNSLAGSIRLQGLLNDQPPIVVDSDFHIADNLLKVDDLMLWQARRPGAIQASGQLRMEDTGPAIELQAVFDHLDVTREADIPLRLDGLVRLSYTQSMYQGHLDLISSGHDLAGMTLSGYFSGDHQQASFDQLQALWLGAEIDGGFSIDWMSAIEVATDIDIRNLSLDPFIPQSSGLINARLSATYRHHAQQPQAHFHLDLVDSFFHDFPLAGTVDAYYEDNNLVLNKLNLTSNSAHLEAQGDLLSQLDFSLAVERLGHLYPQAEGTLAAHGWLRRTDAIIEADIHYNADDLSLDSWQLASLSGDIVLDTEQQLLATATARDLGSDALNLIIDSVDLVTEGALTDHRLDIDIRSQESDLAASIQGSWADSAWNATLAQLHITTATSRWQLREPAHLVVEPDTFSLSPLTLDGEFQQSLSLNGEYLPGTDSLQVEASWHDLSLRWLQNWLDPFPVQGTLDGQLSLTHQPDQTHMAVSALSVADLNYQKLYLQDTETRLNLSWGPGGLDGSIRLDIGPPGHLLLQIQTSQAAGLYLPENMDLELGCRSLPLQLFQSWLPADLIAAGHLGCDVSGQWHGGGSFTAAGHADITAGSLLWYDGEQSLETDLEKADFELHWKGDDLQGGVDIQHDYGHINGSLTVRAPAQLPVVFSDTAPISGDIGLELRENGLLSVFFPRFIYDSQGRIKLSATASGTISEPLFTGSLALDEAEFYIPAAGIRLYDISADAQLKKQQLEVSAVTVTSGDGTISGQGHVDLHGWYPEAYQFSLQGNQFRLVNLSELTVHVSPDLELEGDMQLLRIRGRLLFPSAMIKDQVNPQVVQSSPDVIIVDRQQEDSNVTRIRHDIDIDLVLGDQVLLDMSGIEALVAGSLRLYSDPQQDFAAQGRLSVERGRYSTYGVALDIERGDLYYAGVPLHYPALDILALRRAGEVRAGVRITGTPQEPFVTLFSEPAMPDADILSYMVLGRPLDSSGGDTDLLMVAAGALLSQGESIVLQERLKGRLGLDVLELRTGEGDTMDSVITTGKYFTPDLYVSIGYSLFNNSNEISIRYRLSNRLELESTFGEESGADLFYRLEWE